MTVRPGDYSPKIDHTEDLHVPGTGDSGQDVFNLEGGVVAEINLIITVIR